MLLIIDDNDFRRHDLCWSFDYKGVIFSSQTYEYVDFYTKPFMTLYVNPSYSQLAKIKNENTITIVAKNNLRGKLPPWMIHMPIDKDLVNNVVRLLEEKSGITKPRLSFGPICIEGYNFSVGGVSIRLSDKELRIAKFFLFNQGKKFQSYDANQYIYYRVRGEENFEGSIHRINAKLKRKNRDVFVINDNRRYYFNESLIN